MCAHWQIDHGRIERSAQNSEHQFWRVRVASCNRQSSHRSLRLIHKAIEARQIRECRDANVQRSLGLPRNSKDQRNGAAAVLQSLFGFPFKDAACLGETCSPGLSLEELGPKPGFHFFDLLGERRLRHMAACCRTSEVAFFGHRHEISHLPQLDLYLHLSNISENSGAH